MEDLPTSLLTQQENAKPRTGEELETFGKYAASRYLKGECGSLTEAVVQTVKHAGLVPEQVRRVVEFTNTEAYLRKFASAGPQHKVVNFENGPASLPDVIRDLNDGGGGTVFDKAASLNDYHLPPPDAGRLLMRNEERLGLENAKLAEAFKVPEAVLPFEEPLRDAIDERSKLSSLYDEATYELGNLETHYMEVCDQLFSQVKQAALNGVPLGHVVAAMQTTCDDPEFMKAAFQTLSPRLVENEVFRSYAEVGESLAKFAGAGVVNPDHPIVSLFGDYCETLAKMAATRIVQEQVAEQLDTITTFLKKASGQAEAAKGVLGHIPKAWGVVRDLAAKASGPAGRVATDIAGETAGKIVGKGVKYAPHIAAGLVAEEAYQRAKYSPAVQGPANFVLSRVPYTGANMARKYRLQMGM